MGKKQDKLGRWRSAKVPDYSNDPAQTYAIDERMKELGHWEPYMIELARLNKNQESAARVGHAGAEKPGGD